MRIEEQRRRNLCALLERGRGADEPSGAPVALEPPFVPFDWDARLRDEPDPPPDRCTTDLVFFTLTPAAASEAKRRDHERLLHALRGAAEPVAFEVLSTPRGVYFQIVVRAGDAPYVEAQLRAHASDWSIGAAEDHLATASTGVGAELALAQSPVFMLAAEPEGDPLRAVLAVLDGLGPSESAGVSLLFTSARAPWGAAWDLASCNPVSGESSWADLPDLPKVVEDKIASGLLAVSLRVFASSLSIVDRLVAALGATTAAANELVAMAFGGERALLQARQVNRPGMLLSRAELDAVVHLPERLDAFERIARGSRRTRSALSSTSDGLVLGTNRHRGVARTVTLTTTERLSHLYLLGASGSGKSTLLEHAIVHDLRAGHGVAVIDPHGDLIRRVVPHVPDGRLPDVVLLDPSERSYTVGLNVLEAVSEDERELLVDDVVIIFKRLSSTWGGQLETVLAQTVSAILAHPRGGTLLDLRRFLLDESFRTSWLAAVSDDEVRRFWQLAFPRLPGSTIAPVLTRLDTFLRRERLRSMVSQRPGLDLRSLMDNRGVLFARLAHGTIGEANAALLGALIVARLQQVALGRAELPAARRAPFFLYIDEAHNFVSRSLALILSGARKFGLGLVLAHQAWEQLEGQDRSLADSVLTNSFTRIAFQLGDADARRMASAFSGFAAEDFMALRTGQAIVRRGSREHSFSLDTLPPLPEPDAARAAARLDAIVATNRARFATTVPTTKTPASSSTPSSSPLPGDPDDFYS